VSHPVLYEINTRCWLRSLSEEAGRQLTLAEIPEEQFLFWEELGFTHLWLMGVWRTGPRVRRHSQQVAEFRKMIPPCSDEEIAGSPYAIGAYEVSESLGGEVSLQKFHDRLNSHGLRLILDFVPNHLGLDHSWLDEKPELFVQSERKRQGTFRHPSQGSALWFAHGRDPYFEPWVDTVQLEYRNPATREAMTRELVSIARLCDGVRCDMAMLLLNEVFTATWKDFPASFNPPSTEFWTEAMAAVRQKRMDFEFIAEVYWELETRLLELGFDYTYDKRLYDHLIKKNAAAIQRHLLEAPGTFVEQGVHFIENHDEPRVASLLSFPEHRAAAVVVAGLPGMCLLHEGQLTGLRERLAVQLIRKRTEAHQPEISAFYGELLRTVKRENLRSGEGELLRPCEAWPGNPTAVNFLVIQWNLQADRFFLVVVNLAAHASQCRVDLKLASEESAWSIRGLLASEGYVRDGTELKDQGMFLDLPGHGAQIFAFRPMM
jgi:glycosidase